MSDIVIKKENDGDVIDMFPESSDEDDISVRKRPIILAKNKNKNFRVKQPFRQEQFRQEPFRQEPFRQEPFHQEPANTQGQDLQDNMFEVFTNPEKTRVNDEEEPPEYEGEEYEEDVPEPMFNNEMDVEQPSPGFASVDDEKQDLLYKFYRLQSKGVPVSKKFNIHSDINDMRNEYNKIKRDAEVNASIRFSRRMLMACVTGIEFLNKRYDPFDIKLDGWSESVMDNVDDYDNVFERLHDKYSSKMTMAPEIELLLSLTGSAFMFHLTNSMFANAMPNLKDIASQNPDLMKNIISTMSNMSNTEQAAPTRQQTKSDVEKPVVREMKPPMFDVSSLLPTNVFKPVGNDVFNQSTRNTKDERPLSPPMSLQLSNESNDKSIDMKNINVSQTVISEGGTKRKRGRKINMSDANTISI